MNGHNEMEGIGAASGIDGSSSHRVEAGMAGPSNLAGLVKKLDLDSEYMYPPASKPIDGSSSHSQIFVEQLSQSWTSSMGFNGKSGGLFENGKGKGKARELGGSDRTSDMHERSDKLSASNLAGGRGDRAGTLKTEEFVRVMLQALRDVGYTQTAEVLEAESGYEQEPTQITAFKAAIAGGRWSEAVRLLEELGVIKDTDKASLRRTASSVSMRGGISATNGGDLAPEHTGAMASSAPTTTTLGGLMHPPSSDAMQVDEPSGSVSQRRSSHLNGAPTSDTAGRQALFMILQQKYLELLEANQTKRALAVLRSELAPLAAHSERLHTLSGFIMCLDKDDLYRRAGWDGAAGTSRNLLLQHLHAFLRPGMMIPPRRLATLFDQAGQFQETHCLYHTRNSATSLLVDHRCHRADFPTVSTHILLEHTDEVWEIAWSHDGQYIASGGKDCNVIIWKTGPAPARNCERLFTLQSAAETVSSIAWSPDDSRLLVAADTNLYLWDTKTGTQVCTLGSLHKDVVSAVQWLPGKRGFVSAGMDMKMMFWSWEGSLNRTWPTIQLRIHDFVITPDSKRIIAIAVLSEIKVEGRNTKPVASRPPEQPIPEGSHTNGVPIAIGAMDRHIIIYDYDSGKIVGYSRSSIPCELTSISLSADSKHILLSCSPDELQLWKIEHDEPDFVRKYTGHQHRHFHLTSCFGGRDRNFVLSGSEDSMVYVWHHETGALLEVLEGHSKPVNSVAWNPVFPDIFATCSDDLTIRIWQPPSIADAIADGPFSASTGGAATSWTNQDSLPTITPVSPLPQPRHYVF